MKSNIRTEPIVKTNNFHSNTPANKSQKQKFNTTESKRQGKIDDEYDQFIEEWEETRKFSVYA